MISPENPVLLQEQSITDISLTKDLTLHSHTAIEPAVTHSQWPDDFKHSLAELGQHWPTGQDAPLAISIIVPLSKLYEKILESWYEQLKTQQSLSIVSRHIALEVRRNVQANRESYVAFNAASAPNPLSSVAYTRICDFDRGEIRPSGSPDKIYSSRGVWFGFDVLSAAEIEKYKQLECDRQKEMVSDDGVEKIINWQRDFIRSLNSIKADKGQSHAISQVIATLVENGKIVGVQLVASTLADIGQHTVVNSVISILTEISPKAAAQTLTIIAETNRQVAAQSIVAMTETGQSTTANVVIAILAETHPVATQNIIVALADASNTGILKAMVTALAGVNQQEAAQTIADLVANKHQEMAAQAIIALVASQPPDIVQTVVNDLATHPNGRHAITELSMTLAEKGQINAYNVIAAAEAKIEVANTYAKGDLIEAKADPVVEAKTDPIVENKADSVANTKTDPILETKVDLVVETRSDPIVETKTDSVVETKVDPIVEPKRNPIVENKADPVADTKTDPILETKVDPVVETRSDSIVETKVDPIVEVKTDPVVETKTDSIVETKADTRVEDRAASVVETKADPVADNKTDPIGETPEFTSSGIWTTEQWKDVIQDCCWPKFQAEILSAYKPEELLTNLDKWQDALKECCKEKILAELIATQNPADAVSVTPLHHQQR